MSSRANWPMMTKKMMIGNRRALILRELSEGTGAAFSAMEDRNGLRHGLKIWFSDLDEKHGPVAELRPYGLKGHQITLSFGNFSGEVLGQIRNAAIEDVQLARALVASIRTGVTIEIPGQDPDEWRVMDGGFRIKATIRDLENSHDDSALVASCRDAIVPIMAAMAELIGYDVIEDNAADADLVFEGATRQSVVQRRERNPRNRLLCIRLHGEKCTVCELRPKLKYGEAGSIIEVHHLEPLSLLGAPRAYDPRTDLVPLCPDCHRAIHTRRPRPYKPEELKRLMEACHG